MLTEFLCGIILFPLPALSPSSVSQLLAHSHSSLQHALTFIPNHLLFLFAAKMGFQINPTQIDSSNEQTVGLTRKRQKTCLSSLFYFCSCSRDADALCDAALHCQGPWKQVPDLPWELAQGCCMLGTDLSSPLSFPDTCRSGKLFGEYCLFLRNYSLN